MNQITHNFYNKIKNLKQANPLENNMLFEGTVACIWNDYYTWKGTGERKHLDTLNTNLEQVFEDINNETPKFFGASLSSGAAGFCYVVTMLNKETIIDLDLDEDLSDLDEYLYESTLELIKEHKLDFWHGAFGIVFYFLERLDNELLRNKTEMLLEKIIETINESDSEYWFPNVNNPEEVDNVNFSLSHGQASFLIILIDAYQKGLCKDIIPEIIRKGTDYILSFQQTPDLNKKQYSFFPQVFNKKTNSPKYSNRLAICYGDLNIVLLLYRAGEFLSDPNLIKTADLIGLSSLLRQSEEATLVSDPFVCHGSAGLAQFYKTLHRVSGIDAYLKGYEFWIDKTLDLIDKDLEKNNPKENSLLTGYLGVSLVLLSYISKEQLDWQKIFLL
jgi:lantibiotic biosynthesis protein